MPSHLGRSTENWALLWKIMVGLGFIWLAVWTSIAGAAVNQYNCDWKTPHRRKCFFISWRFLLAPFASFA